MPKRVIWPHHIGEIKKMHQEGWSPQSIADKYGVTRGHIYRVLHDKAQTAQPEFKDRGRGARERRAKKELDDLCSLS